MNEKAAELGLESTHYADPSGLLSDNVSSAYDMARLITHASSDERIASIMRTPEYTVLQRPTARSRSAARIICSAAPTSTCAPARPASSRSPATAWRRCCGCRKAGQQVAVVVLGARSNAGRFMETANLFNWLSQQGVDALRDRTRPAAVVTSRSRLHS